MKSEFGGDCMRKIAVMTVTLVLMLSFVGCTDKTISYNSNLGLDLNGIDYESVEFNVYHSNTQDHKWELLKTFSCSLKVGHFSDIRVEGEKNQVGIAFEDNRVERTENTVSYYGDDVDTYEFNIDGFNGWIGSFKTFEVKDIDGEQFYRLYPISNDGGGVIFNDLKMDSSYDEDEEDLDNILITIKFK